jgi:hypothetical protein
MYCMYNMGNSKTLTAKNQYRKFKTNITRKGIVRPQSQFLHACVYERYICSHDRSAYSAAGNMWIDPGNILIDHRHMNVEIGTQAPQSRKVIHKWDLCCSALARDYCNNISLPVTNRLLVGCPLSTDHSKKDQIFP